MCFIHNSQFLPKRLSVSINENGLSFKYNQSVHIPLHIIDIYLICWGIKLVNRVFFSKGSYPGFVLFVFKWYPVDAVIAEPDSVCNDPVGDQ